MRKLFTAIVNHPKFIVTCFLIAIAVSLCAFPFVSVNYDMTDYLPEDSPSTIALDTLEEEYGGGIPNARAMIKDVTIAEALQYKAKLQAIDGVTEVTWIDDTADITQPLAYLDQDLIETYYQDGNALFSLTLDDAKAVDSIAVIRELIGEENCLTGSSVDTATATTSSIKEIPVIGFYGILFAIFVLALTTRSFAHSILVMIGLGVAVALNAGSNLIFGEISFVTNAAGSILQMAVSLDYSVFLLHRYEEYRATASNDKEAMVDALCSSLSSILSSGLTTVIGFLALCLMRFRIGPDLGLALAKGIALSLITVFVFMPVLILGSRKIIEKTRHRSYMPTFIGFGRGVSRLMVPFVIIFIVILPISFLAFNNNSFYYGNSHIFGTDTKLGQDTEKIEAVYGKNDTYVLLIPKESTATQQQLSDALHQIPEVSSIISYVDTVGAVIPQNYLDGDTLSQLNSENYTRMILTVDADYEGEETFALIRTIQDTAEQYYPGEWLLAGEGVSTMDLKDTVTADMTKVNFLAIGVVFLVLLLTMRSLSLPVLLVLAIETAIWIGLSIPYFTDMTIFYISYLIVTSIQLGATVDYAILFSDRYREFRQEMGKKAAIIRTISTVTVSILTSGSVLTVVGFLMGILSSHGLLSQFGLFIGRGALCSIAIVFFVVPGLLYIFDGLIQKTTIRAGFLKIPKENNR